MAFNFQMITYYFRHLSLITILFGFITVSAFGHHHPILDTTFCPQNEDSHFGL